MAQSEDEKRRKAEYLKAYRADPNSAYNTPEAKAARAAKQKEYWSRPENRERRNAKIRAARSTPEAKAKHNESIKRYYRENEAYREATKARVKAQQAAAKAADPEGFAKRNAEYVARYRARYPEKVKARQLGYNRATAKRNKEFVESLKVGKPCADCGGFFPPVAMDFDHVNGDKFKAVAVLVGTTYSQEKILAEIAKCVLVCSNCHRTRTAARRKGKSMEEAADAASY